jgi:hypothetical protein
VEFDYYETGILNTLRCKKELKPSTNPNIQDKNICLECVTQTTEFICDSCQVPLCRACFNLIHVAKTLKSHKLVPTASEILTNQFENRSCETHQNKPIEFYCRTCDLKICEECRRSCLFDSHETVSLVAQNQKFVPVFKSFIETLRQDKTSIEAGIKVSGFF